MSDDTSNGMTRIDSKDASRTKPGAATDAPGTSNAGGIPDASNTSDASNAFAYEEKRLSFLASFGIGLLHLVIYLPIPTVMVTLLAGRFVGDRLAALSGWDVAARHDYMFRLTLVPALALCTAVYVIAHVYRRQTRKADLPLRYDSAGLALAIAVILIPLIVWVFLPAASAASPAASASGSCARIMALPLPVMENETTRYPRCASAFDSFSICAAISLAPPPHPSRRSGNRPPCRSLAPAYRLAHARNPPEDGQHATIV